MEIDEGQIVHGDDIYELTQNAMRIYLQGEYFRCPNPYYKKRKYLMMYSSGWIDCCTRCNRKGGNSTLSDRTNYVLCVICKKVLNKDCAC